MTAPSLTLEQYSPIIGPAAVAEIRGLARRLEGGRLLMVNSTAVGGGVAELLTRLVPLLKDLGTSVRWEVIRGSEEFFGVTKAIHNALHGAPVRLTPVMKELFLAIGAQNTASLDLDADLVVIHDPQPLPLVAARTAGGGQWIWRCHVDVSHAQRDVWDFLREFIVRYDASVFSAPEFSQVLPIPQYMIHPAIDPLAERKTARCDHPRWTRCWRNWASGTIGPS